MGKPVTVEVEYCGKCNFEAECKLLQQFLEKNEPGTEVVCQQGRRGAFEVKIDGTLVHSKLSTLAFPSRPSVLENVRLAAQGLPLAKVTEEPIRDCVLM